MASEKGSVSWTPENTSFLLLCQEHQKHLGKAGEYAEQIIQSGKVSATMANTLAGLLKEASETEDRHPLVHKLNALSESLGIKDVQLSRRHKLNLKGGILEQHLQEIAGSVPVPERDAIVVDPPIQEGDASVGEAAVDQANKLSTAEPVKSVKSTTTSMVPKVKSRVVAGKKSRGNGTASKDLSELIKSIVAQIEQRRKVDAAVKISS